MACRLGTKSCTLLVPFPRTQASSARRVGYSTNVNCGSRTAVFCERWVVIVAATIGGLGDGSRGGQPRDTGGTCRTLALSWRSSRIFATSLVADDWLTARE